MDLDRRALSEGVVDGLEGEHGRTSRRQLTTGSANDDLWSLIFDRGLLSDKLLILSRQNGITNRLTTQTRTEMFVLKHTWSWTYAQMDRTRELFTYWWKINFFNLQPKSHIEANRCSYFQNLILIFELHSPHSHRSSLECAREERGISRRGHC